MSEQHPRCPNCQGLLKYEPADILGPERVKCILCGWETARPAVPVKSILAPETAKPSPAPSAAIIKRAAPGARITFGTCPACQRPGMNLTHSGKCGRCAYRLLKGIDLLLPSQPPGIAAPRKDPASTPTIKAETKETPMTATIRIGTCPSCKREGIPVPGKKCARCYDRIKKGKDVITGLLLKPEGAPSTLSGNEPEAGSAAPAAEKEKAGKPDVPVPDNGTCNIDIVSVLDGIWSEKRATMLSKLTESKSVCTRLALANSFVERINSLGV